MINLDRRNHDLRRWSMRGFCAIPGRRDGDGGCCGKPPNSVCRMLDRWYESDHIPEERALGHRRLMTAAAPLACYCSGMEEFHGAARGDGEEGPSEELVEVGCGCRAMAVSSEGVGSSCSCHGDSFFESSPPKPGMIARIRIRMYTRWNTYTCICVSAYTYLYMYVSIHVCMCMHVHVHE
jgi:hypothetical protein